jgi:serine/threonine-protein kinase
MASVWLAEDQSLGRQVAVKVLAEQLASQLHFLIRFQREARIAAALSEHPNVVTIYDVGEHEGRPYIVMAYLPGGTVRDRFAAGPVRRADAVDWLRDTASALDFAHSSGVVHRDVKPQNLLFDDDDHVVVADLGIARTAYEDGLTATGELLGTASYISPEQAMGHPATPASDRYALALIAYQLLTGSRPFGGTTFAEQAMQHIASDPAPPSSRAPGLPAGVDEVMRKALAKEPRERPETARDFVDALDEALAQEPEPSAPPPAAAAPTRSRPRAVPAAIAAVVIALVVLGGVVLLSNGGAGRAPVKHANATARPHAAKHRTRGTPPPPRTRAAPPNPIPAGATPASLNQEGFALMNAGRYDQAIPLLKGAITRAPKGSGDLTYAYALYNLGHSLRLAGKAAEAIPYLERRLKFDNQLDVVRRELAAARAQAAG